MRTHDGPHDGENPHPDCYGCEIKAKSFGVPPSVGGRANDVPPRKVEAPSYNKGIAGEHRPGGGFMPYLQQSGAPMGIKQYNENRRSVDERVKRQRQPAG